MRRPNSPRGFTLVEVLIGSTLAAAILAAVLTSFVFLGRSLSRLVNHQALEARGREALTYLRGDLAQATEVKNGTTPTATTLTLVLPAGEVTYSYDSSGQRLHRQASFGANQDFYLLQNGQCACTSFSFSYFTTTSGATTSQLFPSLFVPYSIKQIQVHFIVQSTGTASPGTDANYEVITTRFFIRNKPAPDGT